MKYKCPECGNQYDRLGTHWQHNPGHRPSFDLEKQNILTGVLMGDGTVDRTGKNPRIKIDMANQEYLTYLRELLHPLVNDVKLARTAKISSQRMRESGFRPGARKENYDDIYRLTTVKHPELEKYEDWYSVEGKKFPELCLNDVILKHWYVCDGYFNPEKTTISISAVNEKNRKEKINAMFKKVGLPKPNRWHDGEMAWNKQESKKILDYMGAPVPGFSRKWP